MWCHVILFLITDIPKDHNAFILRAKVSNRSIYHEGEIISILQNITIYNKKNEQGQRRRQTSSVLQEFTVRREQPVCSLLRCYATDTWQCCQLCTVSVYKQALQPTYTDWSPCPPVSTSDAERPPGTPVSPWPHPFLQYILCWLVTWHTSEHLMLIRFHFCLLITQWQSFTSTLHNNCMITICTQV
jgi:hypothetical protein